MLSWFSFWLGLDAIPGRVTLLVQHIYMIIVLKLFSKNINMISISRLVTCMLTLVTMFTGLRADIPPVAYVKVFYLFYLKKFMN